MWKYPHRVDDDVKYVMWHMSTPLNLKADGGHIYKCDLQVK